MNAIVLNEQLAKAYSIQLKRLVADNVLTPDLSKPQLLHVPDGYLKAPVKLLVVGQQTLGWGENHPIDTTALMLGYAEWNPFRDYRSTPFWSAAHAVHKRLNPGSGDYDFLWSNLVKVDHHGQRPRTDVEDAVSAAGLLQIEIALCAPEVVLFLTGPNYDARLLATYPGAQLQQLRPDVPVRQLARVVHSDLPNHTYRTYHPRQLRMRRLSHLDTILDAVLS